MSTQDQLLGAIARHSMSVAGTIANGYSVGAQNSLVVLTRAGAYNLDLGEYDPGATQTIYDDPDTPGVGGPAGITPTAGPISVGGFDEPQYFDSVTMYLPRYLAIRPRIDDIALVIACPSSDIVGRSYRVVSVPAGGRISASTVLQCQGVAPSRQWQV